MSAEMAKPHSITIVVQGNIHTSHHRDEYYEVLNVLAPASRHKHSISIPLLQGLFLERDLQSRSSTPDLHHLDRW